MSVLCLWEDFAKCKLNFNHNESGKQCLEMSSPFYCFLNTEVYFLKVLTPLVTIVNDQKLFFFSEALASDLKSL